MADQINGGEYKLDLDSLNAGFDKAIAQGKQLESQLLASATATQNQFTKAAEAATAYNRGLDAIIAETRAGAAAQRQFAGEISGLVKEIRDQAAAQAEARKAASAAAKERREAAKAAREAAAAEKQAAKEVAEAQRAAAAAAKQTAKESQEGTKKTSSSLSELKGTLATVFTFAAAKAFFDKVVQAGQNTEALLSRLSFANGGNAQAAARDLAFVRAEADRLGLDLATAGNSYGSFTAAAAAANFPLAEARRLFLATASAASTLKLSGDDTQGVLLALNQILSKGSVQAEELRGQIGERLPGAFAIAARSMGVTEKELSKLLETGKVTAQDFLPKFSRELEKTFGDDSGKAVDSLTANLNRAGNEAQAFFLRFQGGASGLLSFLSKSGGGINQFLDQFTQGGRQRLAEGKAQAAIKPYREFVELLFQQVSTAAKRGGRDVSADIAEAVRVQQTELERQVAEATRNVELLQRPRQGGFLNKADPEALAFLKSRGYKDLLDNEGAAFRKEEEIQLRRRIVAEGQLAILKETADARDKASKNELTQLGLIAKQEQLIKDLRERQKTATQENQGKGGDFLLGKGGLDEQLVVAQKELDRLLGKVDKTKAAVDKLTPALRALMEERARLTEAAAAAISKESDDAARRAELTFQAALRAADKIEAELKRREAAVRKAGGRGANADGVIDGDQTKALTQLRLQAMDTYYTELYEITEAREQRLFDLREDTDQKEVEAIDRKYDKLIKRTTDNIERQAIEEARQREQLALRQRQEQERIDRTAALASARATTAGTVFGTGTGVSVIEAKRAEKKALLEIEQKAAQDTLNNTLLLGTKEGELARAQAEVKLAQLRVSLQELEQEKRAHAPEDFVYKLIFGEQDSPALRQALDEVATSVTTSFSQITQAEQVAAAARAQTATQAINELTGQLQAQIALREEGSASNIRGLQQEINEQKRIRREALEEQRKAAQLQVIIDSVQQASSIATAAANVFAAFSAIPFVGPLLGAGAAGALISAFVASKVKAFQAASQIGAGGSFFVGGYTGDGNEHDTSTAVGARPYEYHKREFVMPHDLTDRFRRSLFEPLHQGRPDDIRWDSPEMRSILPDGTLPGKLRDERAASIQYSLHLSNAPVVAELQGVHSRLEAIERSNQLMAEKPDAIPVAGGYLLKWANGSTNYVKLA